MCDDDREPPAKRSKDDLSNPTDILLIETMKTTELLDLNDYCLDDIFGHLNVIDLCSVAQVCKRFQQLAKSYFKRKFSEFNFSTVFAGQRGQVITNQEARDIFSNFGSMMTSVTMTRQLFGFDEDDELLKHIAEYCGETLNRLTLNYFYFTSQGVASLNMLSKSLQELSMEGCSLTSDNLFHLSNFSSLRSLTITGSHAFYAFMDSFPALQYLSLKAVSIPCDSILEQFIVRQKQLKSLKISSCKGISSNVLRSIGKYMENLQRLHLRGNFINGSEPIEQIQKNIQHLSKLKKLRRLSWFCDFTRIGNLLTEMLSNKITMKVFYFGDGEVNDEIIEAIKKMINLKTLGLVRATGLKNQHLIEIAKVIQLRELYIESHQHNHNITFDVLKKVLRQAKKLKLLRINLANFRLDPQLYSDILAIVKERQNGIKLIIHIHSTDLISQETIHMNKNWLIVKRKPRFNK